MAASIQIECEYRLVVAGKKVTLARVDLVTLRDQISAVLDGSPLPASVALSNGQASNWTPEEEEKLRSMVQRGKPFPAIAETLGRSDLACRLRWSKLRTGLPEREEATP